MKEQREVDARVGVSTPSTPRVDSLKLLMNTYVGKEGKPLLRWLVKVDTAITAQRIVDSLSKVSFAMPCLGGRAWSWSYGHQLTDPMCFSTYEVFNPFKPEADDQAAALQKKTTSSVKVNVMKSPRSNMKPVLKSCQSSKGSSRSLPVSSRSASSLPMPQPGTIAQHGLQSGWCSNWYFLSYI
ncbi:unnamed protein product [Phytophthora fragariaefolia]|uniref:Unnamed protein product n=1 Tax=Phytophthora fragariaefolia TaxID=1490495 RepID=A0A9W6UAG0_9STRA|nr:unnamed protein product [Phytophthora fragariaefolia]